MPGNAPGRGTSELEHAIPLPELLAFAFGALLPLLAAALVLLPVPCRHCRCRSGQGVCGKRRDRWEQLFWVEGIPSLGWEQERGLALQRYCPAVAPRPSFP